MKEMRSFVWSICLPPARRLSRDQVSSQTFLKANEGSGKDVWTISKVMESLVNGKPSGSKWNPVKVHLHHEYVCKEPTGRLNCSSCLWTLSLNSKATWLIWITFFKLVLMLKSALSVWMLVQSSCQFLWGAWTYHANSTNGPIAQSASFGGD